MSKRIKFNSGFKFKVVVEALSERYTMQELARMHKLHTNQLTSVLSLVARTCLSLSAGGFSGSVCDFLHRLVLK